ncbi:hypothetical protein C8R43DRAFT_951317 [Mycena crocata]|nr:hypothetical protein C8R43DRAFT_951317 [Mycena crocata]
MYTLPAALFIWAVSHIGSVNGYVPRQDSPATPTAAAIASRATPVFGFGNIPEMTTCNPATIPWFYTAVVGATFTEMTLSITNVGVPQPGPPSSTVTGTFTQNDLGGRAVNRYSFSRRDDITQFITNGFIDPSERSFRWPSANVSAGWYAIIANFPNSDAPMQSSSFYVLNGPDTSCLTSASPSGSSSSANPTSSPPSTPTTSGDPSSSSGVLLPVGGSSSKVNRGAIAGGVIGGLAVLAAAIAAYFYLRYASASTASGAAAKNRSRKWGGLGSTDSKAKPYPSATRAVGSPSGHHHSQSDSVGPMLDSSVYVIGNVGIDSRPSRIEDGLEEDDEVNSYFSPSQEKFSPINGAPIRSPFSDPGHDDDAVPLDHISPLPGSNVTRNSSTSTSSYMNNNFSRPRSHANSPYSGSATSPTTESPYSNNAQNNTSSSLGHPESSSYPPNPSPAYPSGTSQVVAEASAAVAPRRGSAGEPAPTSRRTPRKPVPQYNPTDPALTTPAPPVVPSPAAAQDSDSSPEGSLRSGRPGAGAQDWPNLSHKASFGTEGRPVHYLIPDMPPPQRD